MLRTGMYMEQYRKGEQGRPIPPRSDRFYKVGDDWYFQVRGGTCFGPYPCRASADQAVRLYFGLPLEDGSRGSSSSPTKQNPAKGANVHPFGSRRAHRWRREQRR
ncbi:MULTISPECIES: DUF6316 family protein [Microbulbifer]|nr:MULTISPECIES: DUF6316 family protein [Microbulbifer]